jgi:hypothetical protein
MASISQTPHMAGWLSQFAETDQDAAISLVDEILVVSGDAFQRGIRTLLDGVVAERPSMERKIALYAERPIKSVFGKIPAFFRGSRHGRAIGTGVQPVQADPRDQEVGSEGIVAQLITDYCRQNPEVALSHPGPNKLRQDRVSHIVIVTDFIGSGLRIYEMLESFRYVATLRSWRSYGLLKFVVVAYSGVELGVNWVESQKLKAPVRLVVGCPTVFSSFRGAEYSRALDLCERYPPKSTKPFGFNRTGALIAFAHGCPNNAPGMLWSKANGWRPLFPGRSTTSASVAFSADERDRLEQRANRLLRIRSAREALSSPSGTLWLSTMMVLAAAEAGARSPLEVSAKSGLPMTEVTTIIGFAEVAHWMRATGSLTTLGRQELVRLRRRGRYKPVLPSDDNPFYYPSQLRAP